MTDTTNCPACTHPQHESGTECMAGVDHGPKRWHRCLCLNRPNASRPCPPLMDCQGGALGYSDIWHLQQGRSLQGANGETTTPDVLAEQPTAVVPSAPAVWVDGHPQLEAIASAVYERCETGDGGIVHDDPRNIAVAALAAALPATTDRSAVLRDYVNRTGVRLTAGCPDHGPVGSWLNVCHCEVVRELWEAFREQTTAGPGRVADETQQPETVRRQTVEYFLQTRQDGSPWEDTSSFMDELEWAEERLATRQERQPQFEHRITQRTTTVVVEPAAVVLPAKEADAL